MSATVEQVNPNTVKVSAEISVEEIESNFSKELRRRGATVRLRGFRPGKVPPNLLKSYIGPEVLADVTSELIQKTVIAAVEENSLILAAPAKVDYQPRKPDEPLRFTAELEVHEKPRDVDLAGLKATRRVPEIDDASVQEQIDRLREVNAKNVPVDPPRPAKKGDIARIDYSVKFDEKASPLARDGIEVEVGGGYFLLDLMKETLEGLEPGAEKEGPIEFPKDFVVPGLAGKKGTVHVRLHGLSQRRIPALDDDFAKDVGMESLAALKGKVRADLEEEAKALAEREVDRELMDQLVERAAPSLPPTWLEERLKEHEEAFGRMMGGGRELGEEERNLIRAEAGRRLRQAVLIGWIASAKGLRPNREEVDARLEKMAKEAERPLAQLRAEVAKHGTDSIESDIVEEKVVAAIRAAAAITDGPPIPPAERASRRRKSEKKAEPESKPKGQG